MLGGAYAIYQQGGSGFTLNSCRKNRPRSLNAILPELEAIIQRTAYPGCLKTETLVSVLSIIVHVYYTGS